MLEKNHELVNVPFKMKLDAIPAKRATFTALELGQSGKQLRATVNASTIRLGCLQQLIIDSIRCAISGKFCNLSAPEVSLRDRSGVGFFDQQQPWTLMPNNLQTMHFSRELDTNLLDPFDTLPIKMVFKSKQLLCYSSNNLRILLQGDGNGLDGFALRDTLLVAGTHYLIRTGDLKTYNSTLLFHKIESIKLINKRLASQYTDGSVHLTRRIATMCLMELITMLPSFFAQMPSTAELCLVDGLPIIECLRSLTETLRSVDAHQGPTARPWQLAEISASKLLVALTNSYAEPSLSDDKSTVDSSHDSSSQDPTDDPIAPYWQRMEALASKVPMTLANAHAKSLMGDDELSAKGFVSSWCSIAITSELYLNAVLGLWNAGRPIDRRLLRVMFHILMRDLGEAKPSLAPKS
ncbi:unnamed protein product [Clonostachys rosea f. rosea IK726]|uniref:Uncharacterized protein n=1 Tax=Clonostachys rosea f. rosea IK726 TaxID=1349383 RepID=A0ACA9UBU6_BIOOC|nr:unnamed protein product [Clonostachys rosea f. rosea IK726]